MAPAAPHCRAGRGLLSHGAHACPGPSGLSLPIRTYPQRSLPPQVVCMSFYDIVLDFILMDAFEDLESPPSSVLAVLRNRWLSDSFKETVGGCPRSQHIHMTLRDGLDPGSLHPWLWAPRLGSPPIRQQSPPWAGSPPLGPGEASQGPIAVLATLQNSVLCLSFRCAFTSVCSFCAAFLLPIFMPPVNAVQLWRRRGTTSGEH